MRFPSIRQRHIQRPALPLGTGQEKQLILGDLQMDGGKYVKTVETETLHFDLREQCSWVSHTTNTNRSS